MHKQSNFSDPHTIAVGRPAAGLDRLLAPLANLGSAIRDEIAASLAPVIGELDASRARVSTLEGRVHDLEARLALAASILLGSPITAAQHLPGTPTSPEPARETAYLARRTADVSAAAPARPPRQTSRRRSGADEASDQPEAVPAVAEPPATGSVDMASKAEDATPPAGATTGTEAPLRAPDIADQVDRREPVPSMLGKSPAHKGMTEPAADAQLETQTDAAHTPGGSSAPAASAVERPVAELQQESASPDRAAGILAPFIERGALDMIRFGFYADLTDLINQAVYELLERDYPVAPGGAEDAPSAERQEDEPSPALKADGDCAGKLALPDNPAAAANEGLAPPQGRPRTPSGDVSL